MPLPLGTIHPALRGAFAALDPVRLQARLNGEEHLCECGCGQPVADAHDYASTLCLETEITSLIRQKEAAERQWALDSDRSDASNEEG